MYNCMMAAMRVAVEEQICYGLCTAAILRGSTQSRSEQPLRSSDGEGLDKRHHLSHVKQPQCMHEHDSRCAPRSCSQSGLSCMASGHPLRCTGRFAPKATEPTPPCQEKRMGEGWGGGGGGAAPVVIQRPQGDAQGLEAEEGRQQVLHQQLPERRQRHLEPVGAPPGERRGHPGLGAQPAGPPVRVQRLLHTRFPQYIQIRPLLDLRSIS